MSYLPLRVVSGQAVTGPVVIAIMDGVGLGRRDEGDAVFRARTPNLDRYACEALAMQLAAHGLAVGMPSDDDMGNSEVGHNALGAGRVFAQGAKLVAQALDSGRLYDGDVWRALVARCQKKESALHFVGLLSDGNVHSHIDHLLAMIRRADSEGVRRVYVHALLDGRDVPKTSALLYVERLEALLTDIGRNPDRRYRIASGGGRMITTMDRYEADWRIVERGWNAHVHGAARAFASTREAIETFRRETQGINDQDLPPFTITENGVPVGRLRDGDAVIAFNFRGDRMLELVRAFEDETFDKFPRGAVPEVLFAGMTLYDGDTHRPRRYLVAPPEIRGTLGELLCRAGVTQLACSETQKFGHVTYFWNGNRSGAFDARLERYVEVPSHEPPFDERPEMRAPEITDVVLAAIASGSERLLRLNYANGDMVGHTGNFDAVVRAVETVDAQLGRLEQAVLARGGALVVTADHGNADDMTERDKKTGEPQRDALGSMVPRTSHSLNPVPFYVLLSPKDRARFTPSGIQAPGLGHVAATLACLLGFAQPEGYLPSLVATREAAT
ncbi:MAG: 2,3-bisphosphoglycerate-independent phosphoglycerate mutase [Myxococcota bacterium]